MTWTFSHSVMVFPPSSFPWLGSKPISYLPVTRVHLLPRLTEFRILITHPNTILYSVLNKIKTDRKKLLILPTLKCSWNGMKYLVNVLYPIRISAPSTLSEHCRRASNKPYTVWIFWYKIISWIWLKRSFKVIKFRCSKRAVKKNVSLKL